MSDLSGRNTDGEVCQDCDTQLEEQMLPPRADVALREVEIRHELVCPNPDCPEKESELAPAADGQP